MSMTIQIDLTGLKEILAKLDGLAKPGKVRMIYRKVLNAITKPVLKTAKSLVPERTGQLRKSLGRKVRTYPGSGVTVGVVGPRFGFKIEINGKSINPVHYAHLQENGTKFHAPQPFLRPAWDAHKAAMPATAARIVEEEIAKLVR